MSVFGTPQDNDSDFGLTDDQINLISSEETVRDFTIPDGKYPAKIISYEEKTAQSGNQMFVWSIDLDANVKNKSFNHYTVKGSDNLAYFLRAMKFKPGMKPRDLIGQQCTIEVVKDKPYNNGDTTIIRSKIKSILPLK